MLRRASVLQLTDFCPAGWGGVMVQQKLDNQLVLVFTCRLVSHKKSRLAEQSTETQCNGEARQILTVKEQLRSPSALQTQTWQTRIGSLRHGIECVHQQPHCCGHSVVLPATIVGSLGRGLTGALAL